MNNKSTQKLDEVSQYYAPIKKLETISMVLFWSNAALSLAIPYSVSIIGKAGTGIFQVFFLVLVLIYFSISQVSSLYLVPRAELMRRKQLLSDSFGVPLSQDHTSLYYNNSFSPSVQRLGANTMENALFSKEIASRMLGRKRIIIFGYLLAWLFAFFLRHDHLELLAWITQLVFSGEIIAEWLKLEILRFRYERTYDDLYSHFLHKIGQDSSHATANVLNSFVNYEAAKSSAGILLSTDDFEKLNPTLSKRWEKICQELDMK
ncbi:hypothetical protein IQ259_16710 [Fortiea sp. LEGE XX443]|uniref:hypothetical protein n=1 Tax=Fortiea sp. LEGE XX443 TaxID=1828611 RepID=UPI00187DE50F|nr:hypothetical protein [Fortiea sp. LEGE XX443]MBE9006662.1 hypothetical protein [Fortiea sp. LEGE XX443]